MVLEPGAKLPEGSIVEVHLAPVASPGSQGRNLFERLQSAVGKAKTLPPDAARNVDRDLYGLPGK